MSVAETSPVGGLLGGRYRLEEPIGHGGMSTVYRALDEQLGRAVAVKLFHTGSTEPARQEGELLVLSNLEHHGLVNLFDAGTFTHPDGRAARYMVMTLVTGPTLSKRLSAGALSARHISEIGYDMAEALEYIHSHGVIHRDIKPSNILLVDYGNATQRARARLTDFGIALADDVERMTAEGATTGTAAYLSPEQVAGSTVGPESDVYALGLVLLECFTRAVEFPGSIVESAIARLTRDPVIPAELPEHWRVLLTAMTARSPANRPTGAELVSALRNVVIIESDRDREPAHALFPHDGVLDDQQERRSEIFDTIPDMVLDHATALAARIMSAPIAIVSLSDGGRPRFKSYFGAGAAEIARHVDLTTTLQPLEQPLVIEDGRKDPRGQGNPLVTGSLALRFYVGVPLKRGSSTVGTLSVFNSIPGKVSERDLANLTDIAALVVGHIGARFDPTTAETVAMSIADLTS
jgi:serine/threonine protein kinase